MVSSAISAAYELGFIEQLQQKNTIVINTFGLDLSGVCRGALTHPTRIYIWVTANQKRSDVVLTRRAASF